MEISPQQASEALKDINTVGQRTRDVAAYRTAAPILILWGVVWTVCFGVTHFSPHAAALAWLIGDVVGIAGTAVLGWILPRRGPVLSESARKVGRRLGWFWFLLFLFADAWLAILWPWRAEQFGTFVVTLVMFAYVVMGLWLEMRFMTVLGVIGGALATGAYLASLSIPGQLNLWLAIGGGGVLLASGIYLKVRWG